MITRFQLAGFSDEIEKISKIMPSALINTLAPIVKTPAFEGALLGSGLAAARALARESALRANEEGLLYPEDQKAIRAKRRHWYLGSVAAGGAGGALLGHYGSRAAAKAHELAKSLGKTTGEAIGKSTSERLMQDAESIGAKVKQGLKPRFGGGLRNWMRRNFRKGDTP